ncbi:MAG: ABC transporter ATP-binding protein [Aquihabitans sp.]
MNQKHANPQFETGVHFGAVTVMVDDGRTPRTILKDITFGAERGEMVAVMGPSGSGKSTLINLACGLINPTSGSVAVNGQSPPSLRPGWWADRRRDTVGVVHQRLNLLAGLSAVDNVALALDLIGVRHHQAIKRAMASLDRVGMADLGSIPAEQLSVGEQQRVAIARAIAGERPVLLADEPAAALDRTSADEVTHLLADLAQEGRAVLLVTHDSQQASWADRTIVLRDGVIVDRIEPALSLPTPPAWHSAHAPTDSTAPRPRSGW